MIKTWSIGIYIGQTDSSKIKEGWRVGRLHHPTQLTVKTRQRQKLIPSFMNRDVMSGFVFSGLNP